MKVIAQHATENGFSVAIIHQEATPGKFLVSHFEVARVDDEGNYLVRNRVQTEAEARKLANEFWLEEMGRGEKMIGCGPGAM